MIPRFAWLVFDRLPSWLLLPLVPGFCRRCEGFGQNVGVLVGQSLRDWKIRLRDRPKRGHVWLNNVCRIVVLVA